MEFTKFNVVLRAIESVHMKFFPTFSTILKSALNSEFFDTRKMQKIKSLFLGHICTFEIFEAERAQSG